MDDLKKAIVSYLPPEVAKDAVSRSRILFLVGPTGTGKDTIVQELIKTNKYRAIISHTTRPPRVNRGVMERDGIDYYFIDNDRALKLLKNHQLIEATITHGYMYGTATEEILKAANGSRIAVTALDIKGVRSYRKLSDKIIAVYLLPPNFEALISRLIARYGKAHNQSDIKTRLVTALDELSELAKTDYYYVLINNDIGETTKAVEKIMSGERKPKTNPAAIALTSQLIEDISKYLVKIG
jgi:guanylate kinase